MKHWSKTQTTVCLFQAKLNSGALATDWHKRWACNPSLVILVSNGDIHIYTDATAAIGIARRRGMGRIRHIDVTDPWVQETFNNKQAFLHKVLGIENPADLLTKYTDRSTLMKALIAMGLHNEEGRSAVAPAAMDTTKSTAQ